MPDIYQFLVVILSALNFMATGARHSPVFVLILSALNFIATGAGHSTFLVLILL